jgi:pimeloyl-ACP methyl ester carboxylesterase
MFNIGWTKETTGPAFLGARMSRWRLFAAMLTAGFLGSCAQLHLTQDLHQVIQRTEGQDNFDQHQIAGPTAARVLPYALLAEQSYEPRVYLQRRAIPELRHCIADDPEVCVEGPRDQARADNWLKQWRYVWSCDGPAECQVKTAGASDPIGGLGVQVWVRRGLICKEAIVAFRGTVGGNEGDWESNFHWVLRALPIYDQYDQVRDHIGDFIAHIESDACYRRGVTQIATIGHSLGGGLAQLAAYSDRRVRRIYAFDPSLVTGYYSVDPPHRDQTVIGLRGERIYEHGEILAYGRYILRQFVPPPPCNPRIVNVRFDVVHGSPVKQHSLTDFTTALLREARGFGPERSPMVMQPCGSEAPAKNPSFEAAQ